MVPGLTFDRFESRNFRELIGDRLDQRQFAFFRQDEQQILIGQENELAVAITSTLPFALAVIEVDGGQDAAVEAEGMTFVNDEIVVIGLQSVRRPALFDR